MGYAGIYQGDRGRYPQRPFAILVAASTVEDSAERRTNCTKSLSEHIIAFTSGVFYCVFSASLKNLKVAKNLNLTLRGLIMSWLLSRHYDFPDTEPLREPFTGQLTGNPFPALQWLSFSDNESYNGGGGIRTPVTLSGKTVFKTVAISRSATPPSGLSQQIDINL